MWRQAIKALLLVPTERVEGYPLARCPGLKLSEERSEVATLDAGLGSDLACREDGVVS